MHLLLAMVKPSVQRKRRAACLFKNVSEAKDEKVFEDEVKVIFNIRFTSTCYIKAKNVIFHITQYSLAQRKLNEIFFLMFCFLNKILYLGQSGG